MSGRQPRVWLVTGASQGFGLELARAVLARGDQVIATSRTPEKVVEALGGPSPRLSAVAMDLRDASQISHIVDAAIRQFGRIDVLVNNAGHGLLGAVEEASDAEIQKVFETNVFGLLRVTRAVLPHMRSRRGGHVVNISSVGGLTGLPGFGIYNATKFAVEGLSEAMAQELAPLGIRTTVVEPGPFRTNFLAAGSLSHIEKKIDDYAATAGKTRIDAGARHGKQPGDPARAAEVIIQAVTSDKPPLHLVLGQMALDRTTQKLDALRADMRNWRDVSLATDFA